MIEELCWAFLGILAGTFAGMVPGIHANTIAFMALSLPFERGIGFAVFITAMAVTNAIVDAVPSILLGATSDENANIMLPGHEMLLRGKGLEAIMLSASGGLFAALASIAMMPLFYSLAKNYEFAMPFVVPAAAIVTIAAMVANEKNKVAGLAIVLLSGAIGIISSEKIDNSVFVMITGFFGVTGLAEAIASKANFPAQDKKAVGKARIWPALIGTAASGFTALLPGIGPTQATLMLRGISRIRRKGYLCLTGAMNVGNLVFSLLMLFAIEKGRTGIAVALQNFLEVGQGELVMLLATSLMAAGFGIAITWALAKAALKILRRFDYRFVSAAVLLFILSLVWVSSGATGVLACFTAAGIAFFGVKSKVRRSTCMAFLLFPTILFYLGIGV